MKSYLNKLGIALVTPFDKNDNIDFISLKKLINNIIINDINFLVIAGTTGESSSISDYEKKKLFEFVSETNNNRLKLIAHIGGNNTNKTINEIKSIDFDKSYQALLSVVPYYNIPSQNGILNHYTKISENSLLPIIIYNVPNRTGINISIETIIKLSKIDNIIGIKESCNDTQRMYNIINMTEKKFLFFSGDDISSIFSILLGADGLISVIGNAYPKLVSNMITKCFENNFIEAIKIYKKLFKINTLISKEGNPSGIKEILHHLGICKNILRLPLTKVSTDLSKEIKSNLII
ncbi:MAG: 4-hydroxy-tetrahydrodipicolinate synthase [Bacteroides sp.]|nr:MAG: 4-hydroxy-tetrahydrodipicolinate synthase [Bacteroides sp.]